MKRNIIILILLVSIGIQAGAQQLSLDSCKVYALENNRKIKEAQLNLKESEETRKSTFTNFFPKVNAQLAVMKANDYLMNVETPEMNLPVYDGNPANLQTATNYAYVPSMEIGLLDYLNIGMLTATQPVYAGGRIRNGYKLAELGTKIKQDALNLNTQEIVVKTEAYYWTIVSLEEKMKTVNSYTKLLNNLLKDVQVSYDAGLIQKSDLLKVKLKINEINAQKLQLENGISLSKMALCQHIGINYSDNISLTDTIYALADPSSLYINPNIALNQRSEYQIMNKVIQVEEFQKKLAKGELMPQLAVGVQAQYLDVADEQNTFGIAFASLSIPISDWWGGSHKVKQHDIKIEISKNDLEEKSELLMLQMEKAYKELTESYKQIEVSKSLLEEANEHLKVINDNYQAGIMSTSDLLEAQAISQQAKDGLINAKNNYQIKQIEYKKSIAQIDFE